MRTILLVDDQPMILRVLRLALEKSGWKVETAPNGEAALQRVQVGAPDAMLTDVQMPRMSGRQLVDAIESTMPGHGIRIFVATSLASEDLKVWAEGIPGVTFLEKPVSAHRLVQELKRLCPRDDNGAMHEGNA